LDEEREDEPQGAASVGEWTDRKRPVRRPFPGPSGVDVPLRVAMDRAAYAEVIAHAKTSLDAEVCGVLVGEVCEDEQGRFVRVRASVRGASARQGGAHVTFTQETWNSIHRTLDEKYAKLQIVGWYHSHPGFGVQFSDMDRFIIENFFSGPTQVALVIDPLGGDTAVGVNGEGGLQYVDRFWVEGREQTCRVPAEVSARADTGGDAGLRRDLQAVEARLRQAQRAIDDLSASVNRLFMALTILICLVLVGAISYWVLSSFLAPARTRPLTFIPVPVTIGGHTIPVGVAVLNWEVPPEVDAAYLEIARQNALALSRGALSPPPVVGGAPKAASPPSPPKGGSESR
jgi:proteasome lid subunit RPN8/RPN11